MLLLSLEIYFYTKNNNFVLFGNALCNQIFFISYIYVVKSKCNSRSNVHIKMYEKPLYEYINAELIHILNPPLRVAVCSNMAWGTF